MSAAVAPTLRRLCQCLGCGLPSDARVRTQSGRMLYLCAGHLNKRGANVMPPRSSR